MAISDVSQLRRQIANTRDTMYIDHVTQTTIVTMTGIIVDDIITVTPASARQQRP